MTDTTKGAAIPADADSLIRRAMQQLTAWQEKYGHHGCQWVPPAGDVRWMEDASAYLAAHTLPGAALREPAQPRGEGERHE